MKISEKSTVVLIAAVLGIIVSPAIAFSDTNITMTSYEKTKSMDSVSENTQSETKIDYVMIPNGNALHGQTDFFIPANLGIKTGTTVIWQNFDNYDHIVYGQDEDGTPTGALSSNVLKTGDTFEHKFNDPGKYNYHCALHPWRTGIITVGE